MANPEHLEILKQGVEVWNEWREDNRTVIPDLTKTILPRGSNLEGINFDRMDLSSMFFREALFEGASLHNANCSQIDLNGADLTGAGLVGANLRSAHLRGAQLNRAYLGAADIDHADLSRADLTGADIGYASFFSTNLSAANLSKATIGGSKFVDVDLSNVIGLETVRHEGPSVISINTIYYSRGKIPEVFLRGCGVPESFIVQMRALVSSTEAIQFYSCFISYSSQDQDFSERIYADLQNKGVRCWFAPEDLKIGDRIRDRIDESIRLRDKLLLILSEHSIASDWVEHEVESALEEERRTSRAILFPIRVDDSIFDCGKAWAALIRRTRHIGDFTGWKSHDSYQKAFDRLLRDLRAEEKPIS